jgi:hypothetical protein
MRARPRWGWSGVEEITPLSDDGSLASVLDLLPKQSSSREHLVLELLSLGGRYHRYLHQDEFGPTRAERRAALRMFARSLDVLLRLVSKWKQRCNRLSGAGKRSTRGGALGASPAMGISESFVRLVESSDGEVNAQKGVSDADMKLLERLRVAVGKAALLFEMLDTTTSSDLFLMSLSGGANKLSRSDGPADPVSGVLAEILWIRELVGEVLKLLSLRKGPDARTSFPLLVWELCDLWQRETGLEVTSSAHEGGDYKALPRSVAGRFVLAAVEALQPSKKWLEVHASEARTMSASLTLRKEFGRAVAVNTTMNRYVAHHPSPSRKGRRKKSAHTI